jgi:hypothetical protein
MAEPAANKRFLPRWLVFVMVPGLLGPLLILGFIFVSELAHDEARCPYQHVSIRKLADAIAVREDRRSCLWDVEERRFTVIRGANERAIGRRRFRGEAFAAGQYHWEAELGAEDQVRVSVHNEGHADAAFREGTAAERGH